MTDVEKPRSVNELSLELALLKAVRDQLAARETEVKFELQQALPRGTAYATLEGEGGDVATVVSTPASGGSWEVIDEAAFLRWVKERRPTAVVEAVRDSDRKDILARLKPDENGEVPEWAGVGNGKKASVQVRQTPVQRNLLVEAWREGRLGRDIALPEIEGGDR